MTPMGTPRTCLEIRASERMSIPISSMARFRRPAKSVSARRPVSPSARRPVSVSAHRYVDTSGKRCRSVQKVPNVPEFLAPPELFGTRWIVLRHLLILLTHCVTGGSAGKGTPPGRLAELMSTPTPTSFADLGVPEDLLVALKERGIESPFPVQALTIPDGLAGRDVCGQAKTGSGKTLAFGIPLVVKVGRAQPKKPEALILVPTRELALQVDGELRWMADACGHRVAAVYGGASMEAQKSALTAGCEIVVATPGRLIDLVGRGDIDLSSVILKMPMFKLALFTATLIRPVVIVRFDSSRRDR